MKKGLEFYACLVTVIMGGFVLYCEIYKPNLCFERNTLIAQK